MGTARAPGVRSDPFGTYRNAENASRYPRERVHISLRTGLAGLRGLCANR